MMSIVEAVALRLGPALWSWGWLAFVLLGVSLWALRPGNRTPRVLKWLSALLALEALLFVQARFLEPHMIVVHETTLLVGARARVALISDLHVGLFKDQHFLRRVVERLNAMPLDAVLIAGDFRGRHDRRPLRELLGPLAQLKAPVYAVPGNHDVLPSDGPPALKELSAAWQVLGVRPLQGRWAVVGGVTVVGVGDLWAGQDDLQPLHAAPRDKPLVVLTHNPDTAMKLQPGEAALLLAGHTHGGQLRIPGLFRHAIPCQHPFDRGLHGFAPVPVFVTAGLGETAVPMRWMNPPVIDVLELQ
jgi:predicted MPP superfamily phosphohydrolase